MSALSPREATFRLASVFATLPCFGAWATFFLPIVRDHRPIYKELHDMGSAGVVAYAAYSVPAVLVLLPLIALTARKAPGYAECIIGTILNVVLAFATLFILTAAIDDNGPRWMRALSISLPTAALFLLGRARGRVGWERWMQIAAASGACALALSVLLVSVLTERQRVGQGAEAFLLASGVMLPLLSWTLWPRTRAPGAT